MPGIHVRSLGRIHWENKDKEPALTVPGSYWLCHKNNIYKFTFKFHKTIRNTTNFSYSKELMKIIRRVIKWQPREGQHFSTKNLLVTNNHASWTRQDKMFAVMKFCDRPDANAFPHAFILTVKILNQEKQQQNEEAMGAFAAKADPETSQAVCSVDDKSTSGHPHSENQSENEVQTDNSASVNGQIETKSKNEEDVSWSRRTRSRSKDEAIGSLTSTSSTPRQAASSNDKSDHDNDEDVIVDDSGSEREMDCKCHDEPAAPPRTLSQQKHENNVPIVEDEDSNGSSANSDSANLPYQYLIERDIERELEKAIASKGNTSSNPCDSSIKNEDPEEDSKTSKDSRKSAKFRSRQGSKDLESTSPLPDVANLRSSDITDLVMKGLMFTIRQDKDTVTVVEQKTKLELDEVLENSEKVETKEGDPCLLNSSLLRLEKMITRMQEPVSLPEQRHNGLCDNALVSFMDLANEINIETEEKLNEADIAEKSELSQNSGILETANCWSPFFTDKEISNTTLENIEKTFGDSSMYVSDDNQDEDMELKIDDEEEEDIVPEALVNHHFFDNAVEAISKTSNAENQFQDLLMDDIEPSHEKTIEEKTEQITISEQIKHTLAVNGTNATKHSSRLPKIISVEIITNDQIPPGLLKALKNKSAVQQQAHDNENSLSNGLCENNNKINTENIENNLEFNTEPIVDNKVENNIAKVEQNQVESITVTIEKYEDSNNKNNVENCQTTNFMKDTDIVSRSSYTDDNKTDKKCLRSMSIKSNDISNSNSIDNVRSTRSNSKSHVKPNETLIAADKSKSKHESSDGIKTRKMLEKSPRPKLTPTLSDNVEVPQKRKKSVSDQSATKFCKRVTVNGLEKKEVRIKVWKLLNDIRYGVKVVVERMDVKNIPR